MLANLVSRLRALILSTEGKADKVVLGRLWGLLQVSEQALLHGATKDELLEIEMRLKSMLGVEQ